MASVQTGLGGADPAFAGQVPPAGANAGPEEDLEPGDKRLSRGRIVLRRFLRNKTAVVGLIGYGILVLIALIGPLVSPWGYQEIDQEAFLQPPGGDHPLGTTQAGRDLLALTIEGLRKSMLISIGVALIQTFVAACVGAFAAYFGGWLERLSLWVIDLLLVVPSFLIIAIIMVGTGGGSGSVLVLILLLSAFGWMLSARVVRSMTMSVKNLEYVTAARYMGVRAPTIIFRHVIPNISSLLIIDATLAVAAAVLGETSLSFFGFGVQSPETSLGTILSEGQRNVASYPWIFQSPAIVLVVMILCVNFIGDGLRDALDPSSKSGGHA
ncbi:ABC transporter permease [Georgenia alba]|uniref:Oligopeptide transport system permease protein OppC n=1 Tax=Georgenia alba TaxID=2233858 RepID=A0ABW2Q640_9MICO